jgi:hypothetical protein
MCVVDSVAVRFEPLANSKQSILLILRDRPIRLGETLSSRVPFLLTISTSHPITVSAELAFIPSMYP